MTFPLKLNLSLLFLLSLFLFPFPTFAATGNHGSICEGPDDDNQTCLFDKTKGQPTVHLKWDLSAKGITGPAISCWLTSGTSTDVVADDNTNDHDGYENDKIRVPSTNRYYKTTDPDPLISPVGYINPTTIPQNAIRFQAKDDVYVYPPEATTTVYTVHCCTAVNGPAWPGCHLRDPQSVTRTVVAKEACEVPFGAIKENLKNGEPIHITESNLKSWVETTQDLDYSKNGSGSGDSRDISDYLISNQRDYRGCTGNGSDGVCITQLFFNSEIVPMESMSQEWKNKIDEAVTTVNSNGSPVELTIRALNWPIRIIGNRGDIPSAHSVILVGLSGSEEQGYKFDIVDPNIPDKITYLENCRYSKLSITYDHKTDEYFGLGCSPLDIVVYPKAGPVFIRYIDDKGSSAIRASVHKNFCNQSGNNNYRDLCSRVKITDWLKNNLTKFENLPAGGGTCEAWSKFYLDMAYLGDFVGTDFSPGDGKFVSADGSAGCDMNHYPPAKKSVWLDSANWLGNVFSAWTKLWP